MLRVVGLALLFLVVIAGPVQSNDIERVADGGLVQDPTTAPVQAPRALPAAPPTLRAGYLASFRRELVDQATGAVLLRPQRRQRQNSIAFPWLSQGRSGVALPLSERLLVGLGYRHMQGEDLWPGFADTGAVDYDSHHVLVRAHWRF